MSKGMGVEGESKTEMEEMFFFVKNGTRCRELGPPRCSLRNVKCLSVETAVTIAVFRVHPRFNRSPAGHRSSLQTTS